MMPRTITPLYIDGRRRAAEKTAAAFAARRAARIEDFDWLLEAGEDFETAARRAGWPTLAAAEIALRRAHHPRAAEAARLLRRQREHKAAA